ncbi:hypothetical protein CHA01nite_12890 [Chryseobacterium hagamense]|uniref:Uncharacterized protein n=1 Tax=Chryseobacterium hagamense TaxID=395935 RepID=A0A511YK20_9FLAO|nr:hypothetical protein CHA01nite_12890 [Chryseobacterium hagamense]
MIVIIKQIPCPKRSVFMDCVKLTLSLLYELSHKIILFLSVFLKSTNQRMSYGYKKKFKPDPENLAAEKQENERAI